MERVSEDLIRTVGEYLGIDVFAFRVAAHDYRAALKSVAFCTYVHRVQSRLQLALSERSTRLQQRQCALCDCHVACLVDLSTDPPVTRLGIPFCTKHFKIMRGIPFIRQEIFL
jgi:hypothetical protein